MAARPAPVSGEAEVRLSLLGAAPPVELESLADQILLTAPVEMRRGPEVVTTPLRLPVPGQASTFVVGHAVLTVCEVSLAGTRGDAIVAGRAPRAAVAAAVCDAEVERAGAHAGDVRRLVSSVQAAGEHRAAAEAAAVRATRIDGADAEDDQ